MATCSSRAPSGDATQLNAFWSSTAVSQSAASAGGRPAAGDEVEHPRTGRSGGERHAVVEQPLESRGRAAPRLGQGPGERGRRRLQRRRARRIDVEGRQVGACRVGDLGEGRQRVVVVRMRSGPDRCPAREGAVKLRGELRPIGHDQRTRA